MVNLPVPSADMVANPTLQSALTQITPSPATEHVELRLRQDVAPTCGYLSADTASPLTCGGKFSCTRGTYSEFGCCNKLECDANYAVACIDPSNQQCQIGGYEFDCQYLGTVMTCPNACVTYILKVPGAFSTGTYKSYSCDKTGGTRLALAVPTNGAGGGDSGDGGNAGGVGGGFPTPPELTIPGLETTTAGNAGSNNGGNNGGNTGSTNGQLKSVNEGGGLNAGAIAGIAIGGVVVALLVGLGIWWMCRQRSKKAPPPNYSQTVVSGWLDQTH